MEALSSSGYATEVHSGPSPGILRAQPFVSQFISLKFEMGFDLFLKILVTAPAFEHACSLCPCNLDRRSAGSESYPRLALLGSDVNQKVTK